MAELLQREFSLPVVKVRLSELQSQPAAHFELVVNTEGTQTIVATQTHPLDRFGFGEPGAPQLQVPDDITRWVAVWAESELDHQHVLWLHLVKPYGLLGAVPWERDIQPELGIPFLRLPDVLPSPIASTSTFHVALLATAPAEEGPSTAAEMGPAVAAALAAGLGDRARLHVFADRESHGMLDAELAEIGGVVLYQPDADDDPSAGSVSGKGLQNPWLQWIRRAMKGTALDAVHFVTHGYALGDEGAILTTPSPASLDRRSPQAVQAGELRQFLNQVGALVAGFSRPSANYSDFGLRKVVDDLGSLRAGPVLLHDSEIDPAMESLRDAYRFLATAAPSWPPADASLTLFAQPRQVANIDAEHAPDVGAYESLASSEAVEEHFAREETPVWLSAAERFIDENEANLLRFEQSKEYRAPTKSEVAYYAGVESALGKIRAAVNKHAEEQL